MGVKEVGSLGEGYRRRRFATSCSKEPDVRRECVVGAREAKEV